MSKTLGHHQIQQNYSSVIAWLDVDGAPGELRAKTRKGPNGDIDILLKIKGEKVVTITKLSDNYRCADVPELMEEYIDTDCIVRWADDFCLEPHINGLGHAGSL